MTEKRITFGKKQGVSDKMAVAEALLGAATGTRTGNPERPSVKWAMKGTNPLKGKVSIGFKAKF